MKRVVGYDCVSGTGFLKVVRDSQTRGLMHASGMILWRVIIIITVINKRV